VGSEETGAASAAAPAGRGGDEGSVPPNSMRLPAETVISEDKLVRYLLVPQLRGDKSSFLRKGGYELSNAAHLLRDLRNQILPLDAIPLERNQFGQYYEIRGALKGPNGTMLSVRTIWMTEHLSGATKFITLIPDNRRVE
jgi:hypothetical protein